MLKSFQILFLKGLHMFNATLTTKGQTTIPIEVREGLKLQPQDKLNFTLLPDGTVIMRAKKRVLTELVGLAGYTGAKVSLAKMKSARAT
jgi:antitoxin PrlF